jgi:hypothetical protein
MILFLLTAEICSRLYKCLAIFSVTRIFWKVWVSPRHPMCTVAILMSHSLHSTECLLTCVQMGRSSPLEAKQVVRKSWASYNVEETRDWRKAIHFRLPRCRSLKWRLHSPFHLSRHMCISELSILHPAMICFFSFHNSIPTWMVLRYTFGGMGVFWKEHLLYRYKFFEIFRSHWHQAGE